MSGNSDTKPCPICRRELEIHHDLKPIDRLDIICGHCGFRGYTVYDMAPIDEVRLEHDIPNTTPDPLTPKQRRLYIKKYAVVFGRLSPAEEATYLNKTVPKPKAIVSVHGGVAYLDQCPEGFEVEIIDYDNREEPIKKHRKGKE